jgi:hypothetical protein
MCTDWARRSIATFGDIFRVARLLPAVELQRRRGSIHSAVALARKGGMERRVRSSEDRAGLKRVIGAVDRRLPGGGNCVRRALLEIALDGGAAREHFFAGLRSGGGSKSGHAWLESDSPGGVYDAVVAI